MKTVLILTGAYDPHVPLVAAAIGARGANVLRFNLADFPETVSLRATLDSQQKGWTGSLVSHAQRVPLDALTSIWWRRPTSYKAPTSYAAGERAFLEEEANRGFVGILDSLTLQQTLWVSRLHSLRRAELKPLQLAAAQQLGLRTPRTVLTNDPDTARAFYNECQGQVVLKAVSSFSISIPTGSFTGCKHICTTAFRSKRPWPICSSFPRSINYEYRPALFFFFHTQG